MARLILYYPVSALVTLFANILQNPADARARSDIKLMNMVVNFLSMLVTDESNGNIRRMLGICSEFERIAKVVVDKNEKESHSRRKRRANDDKEDTGSSKNDSNQPEQTPTSQATPYSSFSPDVKMSSASQAFSPNMQFTSPPSQNMPMPTTMSMSGMDIPLMGSFPTDLQEMLGGPPGLSAAFGNAQTFTQASAPSPLNSGAFNHPIVPQDLWQMPMTLEWDWADLGNIQGMPGFDENDMNPQMRRN